MWALGKIFLEIRYTPNRVVYWQRGVTFKIITVVIRLQFRHSQQSWTKYSLSGQNTSSLVYHLSWFFLRTLLNRQAIPHPLGLGMLCFLPGRMGNICPGSVASQWSLPWGDLTLWFSNLEIQVDLKSLQAQDGKLPSRFSLYFTLLLRQSQQPTFNSKNLVLAFIFLWNIIL